MAWPGCAPIQPMKQLPLTLPTTAKNGVVLDVLFVRFPADDPQLNKIVWEEIDELHFPAEVRRRLERNGLRAGVIAGPLPLSLENLIQLQDKPQEHADEEPKEIDVEKQPAVKQRQLRLTAGRRSNILTLGETERVPEMSLLMLDDEGQVKGRTYRQVLGMFAARAFPGGDGGARLELIPELEHGTPQKRFVPGDGMFHVEFGPPHEVLNELKLSANLAPGQFVVVGADANRSGSLGYRFFTEERGAAPLRKMLLIRLAQADFDDRFSNQPSDEVAAELKPIDLKVTTHENAPDRDRVKK